MGVHKSVRRLYHDRLREAGMMPGVGRRGLTRSANLLAHVHMFLSFLSWSTSPTNSTTVFFPTFFHQCEVGLVSGRISPVLCTIGPVQLLAYSTISPCAT